ncbi:hypothetical protein OAE97_03940 [Verrucomicrobia bacterium]|nr:hypothetical protein [Verrucomicrobiota bacterium]
MKTTRLDTSGMFEPLTVKSDEIQFTLPPEAVNVRANGVEFLSSQELPVWSELTIELRSPKTHKPIQCNGIVVGAMAPCSRRLREETKTFISVNIKSTHAVI